MKLRYVFDAIEPTQLPQLQNIGGRSTSGKHIVFTRMVVVLPYPFQGIRSKGLHARTLKSLNAFRSDLWHGKTFFKKTRYRFVLQVMEMLGFPGALVIAFASFSATAARCSLTQTHVAGSRRQITMR